MTLPLFFGCLFVAFGLGLALFFRLVFTKAQLMIVFISASFFWLLSLTVASLVWFVVPPLKEEPWFYVTLSAVVQEALRILFFRLYSRSESSFSVISTNAVVFPLTDFTSSFAAGLGYGLTQTVLVYGSVVSSASSSGTYFSDECSQMSIFVLSAWSSFFFVLLHIFWMMIAFDAYRRLSLARAGIVAASHLAAVYATLVNRSNDGCVVSLPLLAVLTAATGVVAYRTVTQPDYRSKLHAQ